MVLLENKVQAAPWAEVELAVTEEELVLLENLETEENLESQDELDQVETEDLLVSLDHLA